MVEVQNSPEDGSEKYHDYAIEKKVLGALPEKHARAFRKLNFDEQRRIRNGVKNAYGRDVSAVRTTLIVSTASGALVVGGVRDICSSSTTTSSSIIPEIGLSVQWRTTNQ